MRITASMKEEMMYALSHARGYADIFDLVQRDRERAKRIKEQCIVDDFLDARYRGASPFLRVESCEPPLPDCVGIYKAGGKIGFEATELVDPRMVRGTRMRLMPRGGRITPRTTYFQELSNDSLEKTTDCKLPRLLSRRQMFTR